MNAASPPFDTELRALGLGPLSLLDHWRTRRSILYRYSERSGASRLIVKVGFAWEPETPELICGRMKSFSEALRDARFDDVAVPEPLWWSATHRALGTEYVEGTGLDLMLKDGGHPEWAGARLRPDEVMRVCGRILGLYHSLLSLPGDAPELDPGPVTVGHRVLRRIFPLPGDVAGANESLRVRSFDDFQPGNVLIAPSRKMFVIDFPAERGKYRPPGLDVALFTLSLRLKADRRMNRRKLRREFLLGYGETGVLRLRTKEHLRLITAYEGFLTASRVDDAWKRHSLYWLRRNAWRLLWLAGCFHLARLQRHRHKELVPGAG